MSEPTNDGHFHLCPSCHGTFDCYDPECCEPADYECDSCFAEDENASTLMDAEEENAGALVVDDDIDW